MDGHQHVHLVPIVLGVILEIAPEQGISWLRTTAEPLPTGLSWRYWQLALTNRWLAEVIGAAVAQPHSTACNPALGLASNQGFAGVLFVHRSDGSRTPPSSLERSQQQVVKARMHPTFAFGISRSKSRCLSRCRRFHPVATLRMLSMSETTIARASRVVNATDEIVGP